MSNTKGEMMKQIPKFLHKQLRDTIGKKANLGDIGRLLGMRITTQYDWTERVIQYANVHFEARDTESLEVMLSDSGTLHDFTAAYIDGDIDECMRLIEHAIDNAEDALCDNRYDLGEEVDRDYLDEEYEDTVESGYESYVSGRNGTDNVNAELDSNWAHHQSGARQFYWTDVVRWLFGQRRTPLTDRTQEQYLSDNEDY
jgi:hypothetical protein